MTRKHDMSDDQMRIWIPTQIKIEPGPLDTPCWIWQKSLYHSGYGRLSRYGTEMLVHRGVYEIFCGFIPDDKQVNHKCDVRACCNPDHLYLGTQSENIKEAFTRNRKNHHGIKHSRAKLTNEQVLEIYNSYGNDLYWAAKFNVHKSQISSIRNGWTWTSVTKHRRT